ncbi:hypothetical protein B0H13DRAFT_2321817 [Mycena leptocephala]|nr:hypothetical protein B0H13DRAFT_2321817 [Mycena leptocephala]
MLVPFPNSGVRVTNRLVDLDAERWAPITMQGGIDLNSEWFRKSFKGISSTSINVQYLQLSALQTRPGTRATHPSVSSSAAPPASARASQRHSPGTPHHPHRPQPPRRNRPAATAILTRLEKPVPGLTREFFPCDLTLIANAKRTAAALLVRFPHVHFLFLSPGAVSLKGLDIGEESVDRQMAALYYSKWAFIQGLLLALRAVHGARERARASALHTAGRGRPIVPQLASYQDLMAEVFAADDANAGISFTHAFPGTVDTPLLRASPSAILRAVHYVRFLIFPTLMFRVMSITECGEYQLYGLLHAPPGASRTGGAGEDIGLGGVGDPTWDEAHAALGRHSEGVVGGVEV